MGWPGFTSCEVGFEVLHVAYKAFCVVSVDTSNKGLGLVIPLQVPLHAPQRMKPSASVSLLRMSAVHPRASKLRSLQSLDIEVNSNQIYQIMVL